MLSLALWGHRTTERTSTRATPYSLVYGMEAVLLVELELPLLKVLAEMEMIEDDFGSEIVMKNWHYWMKGD